MFLKWICISICLLMSSLSFAELSTNCVNENTFLKLGEPKITSDGESVAELYINFKDLNRIINLPEVVLHPHTQGMIVSEATGQKAVLLNFLQPIVKVPTKQMDASSPSDTGEQVLMSIQLDGQQVRKNALLNCIP